MGQWLDPRSRGICSRWIGNDLNSELDTEFTPISSVLEMNKQSQYIGYYNL